ncbi:MAG: AmmeMemoRadiSam system radical SAM enzyme [Dethiobacteria bacterium]
MHKALYFQVEQDKVRCLLCPKYCLLGEGQIGLCGVRTLEAGILYAANYGCLAAANWDPIEKKPLYHYYPGHEILSLGTIGCNFHCTFCQNWTLARGKQEQCVEMIKPDAVLAMLKREGGPKNVIGVAYTYNEPMVWYEFVLETSRLLHQHGYRNVLVTNGFINPEPLSELLPYIDAMNIDVKGFTDRFYRKYCKGEKEPVIKTVETAVNYCHVEVTCLLIPTLNDDPAEQEELARWLSGLNPDCVLHYSRYFPQYKLELPPTPVSVMEETLEIARRYLRYVYPGNIDLPGASDTFCPHCQNLLIARNGYRIKILGLVEQHCNNCGNAVNIILPTKNC